MKIQDRYVAGLLALGAIELPLAHSRKRAFLLGGDRYILSTRAVRIGRTVQTSRPVSEKVKGRILAAIPKRSPEDAFDRVFS